MRLALRVSMSVVFSPRFAHCRASCSMQVRDWCPFSCFGNFGRCSAQIQRLAIFFTPAAPFLLQALLPSFIIALAALAAPPLFVGTTGGAIFVTLRIQSQ